MFVHAHNTYIHGLKIGGLAWLIGTALKQIERLFIHSPWCLWQGRTWHVQIAAPGLAGCLAGWLAGRHASR
jgi:hypothetical protein